jgi:hypothetical protein
MSQSSHRKGWLLVRSEALAAAQRAMNALAPSEDMGRRIKAGLGWGKSGRKEAQKTQYQTARNMNDIMELCDVVRETAFAIHRYHRSGHLEKVYEKALAHRERI